jgi:cytochrome c oxidase subunit 2
LARKHAALLACLALVSLAFSGAALAGNGGIAPPDTATPSGDTINEVYWVVFAICAVVFVGVESTLILFVIRYRRRPGTPVEAEGPQVHGNTRVEIFWTLVPALILLALAIYTFARIPAVQAKPGGADARSGVQIDVQAHQFYWQYNYPNGAISLDTLYLPVDRTATLELEALDVEHSWWVPELTGKLDAIPGQKNVLHFKPTRTGTYENGKCAEFCGVQHALMLTRVVVLSQDEFERWLGENEPSAQDEVALGKAEWDSVCAKCHGFEGEGDVGPQIAGNGALASRQGLEPLLFEGQDTPDNPGYMPPVGRGWQDRQIDAILAYLKSQPKLLEGETSGG